ncbi:hypothetical protein V2J09_005958 [Rumex salicifolius]
MKFVGKVVGLIRKVRVLWKEWDIRSFVMASFSIQLLLILVAPLRKRTDHIVVIWATWLGYLLADWVAVQAVGLIMRGSGAKSELLALWAQFLLIHLGGPDTITALAMEDTALWLRTGLNLCTQVYPALGILARSAADGLLWTALLGSIFLAGIIKYAERVAALFHGRLTDGIWQEPRKYAEELRDGGGAVVDDVQLARHSFCLFKLYRRIYADVKLDPTVRRVVRRYTLLRTPGEAYKLVGIHLSLLYESIYTKASLIHRSTLWRILRHLAFLLQLGGLALWCFTTTKPNYSDTDIRITNALFIGGIAVEGFAFLRILISDWNIACRCRRRPPQKIKRWLYNKILSARYVDFPAAADGDDDGSGWSWMRRVFLTRWSHSIRVANGRIPPCLLHSYFQKVLVRFGLVHFAIRHSMTGKTELSSEMWCFIFEVLTKPPCDNTAVHTLPNSNDRLPVHVLVARALPLQILDYDFVANHWFGIITWDDKDEDDSGGSAHKYISKTIANYLLYLYALQPNMMFGAAGRENVLRRYYGVSVIEGIKSTSISVEVAEVEPDDGSSCKFGILSSELVIKTNDDRVKAEKQMKEVSKYLKNGAKWEVIARVWVELLCHAAISCRASVHAAQLKEGGEFLSFVWLLMLHLGIGPETLPRP